MNNLETKNNTLNTSNKYIQITLKGLPKISLNKWYSGEHWTIRNKLKETYIWIVKSQFKDVLSKANVYECEYTFTFKSKPLDASNTIAMVKMIEDIIFEDDKWDVVTKISISSIKGIEDIVDIKIKVDAAKHTDKLIKD